VKNAGSHPSPLKLIEMAIERGVPLFNGGNARACKSVYEITANALLGLPDEKVGAGNRRVLAKALKEAAEESATDGAWTLRRALDKVYGNLGRKKQ